MSGHTPFDKIRQQRARTAEREATVEQLKRAYRDIMNLAGMRESRGITQSDLGSRLAVSQANISRLEREHDLYLSTLASYVAGLGGTLRIQAVFPDETYTVANFEPTSSVAADPATGQPRSLPDSEQALVDTLGHASSPSE